MAWRTADESLLADPWNNRDRLLAAARAALEDVDQHDLPDLGYVDLFSSDAETASDDYVTVEASLKHHVLDALRIEFARHAPQDVAALRNQLDEHAGEVVRAIVYDEADDDSTDSVLFYADAIALFLHERTGSVVATFFVYPPESESFRAELDFQERVYQGYCADLAPDQPA